MTNLTEWLFERTKNKEKVSLSIGEEQISYVELYSKIKSLSKTISKSFGSGKNMVLVSDNSFFFVISYLSIIGSGNVCVPIKYDKNLSVHFVQKKTDSKILFVQEKYLELNKDNRFSEVITEKILNNLSIEDYSFESFMKDKLAVINFTSGTTGEPKGAMITHQNIITNTDSIMKDLSITEKDKILVVLPFSYCFGASLLHTHLRAGGEIRMNNNFLLPQKVLEELVHTNCTGFAGVPTTFQILLKKTKIKDMSFPKIRCIQQAGGKLANNLIEELMAIFGKEKIFVMYGQTEATARLSVLNPKYLPEKLGSVGCGLSGVEIKLLNSLGKFSKPDEEGEIVVRGENIMLGYYNDSEETKRKFFDGFLKTGDVGLKDKDGFIYITGRAGDFIKSRGHRVSKTRLEEEIGKITGIVEVAILGFEDELLGERIVAFVSTNRVIDKREIFEGCSKVLHNYEVPKEIIILKELPKNNSYKIDYTRLKRDYSLMNKHDKSIY